MIKNNELQSKTIRPVNIGIAIKYNELPSNGLKKQRKYQRDKQRGIEKVEEVEEVEEVAKE